MCGCLRKGPKELVCQSPTYHGYYQSWIVIVYLTITPVPIPAMCHLPVSKMTACTAIMSLKCPCGRIQQSVPCSKSVLQPNRQANCLSLQSWCTNEHAITQQSAPSHNRTHDWLRHLGLLILPRAPRLDKKILQAVFLVEIQRFAKANIEFLGVVEKVLAEYVLFCLKVGQC